MIRRTLAAALLVALAGLVPGSAQADHCSSDVIIFSGPSAAPSWVNSNAVTCAQLAHDADGRIINPGADAISVSFIVTPVCTVGSTVTANVNGLGFNNQSVTLTCSTNTTGVTRYNSARLPLAAGPASSGCVTATILGHEDAATSFHTVDSSCPDF